MENVFLKRHASDAWFWGLVWIYCVTVIGFGFAPPVKDRFFDDFQEPASYALVFHVWTFSAWMCLLAFQAYLAANKRVDLHRKFGTMMIPLAAAMVWSALTSELQFHHRTLADGGDSSDFFAVTATYLLTFVVLVSLAWWNRANPPAHKRLILLATAAILAGSHMRIWGGAWPESWFEESYVSRVLYFFGGTLIILSFGIAHDLVARSRLHPVYLYGSPGLIAIYMLAIGLYDSPAWAELLRPILAA